MCEVIAKEIRHYAKNVKTRHTTEPDIIFEIEKGGVVDCFAIEVETGSQIKKPEFLREKVEKNNSNKKIKEWWFLVINKDDAKLYSEFHLTLKRTEIKPLLEKLFENIEKQNAFYE